MNNFKFAVFKKDSRVASILSCVEDLLSCLLSLGTNEYAVITLITDDKLYSFDYYSGNLAQQKPSNIFDFVVFVQMIRRGDI